MYWIRGAEFVITVDRQRRVIRNGSIIIEGEKIIDVGNGQEIEQKYAGRVKPSNVLDASGCVISPGLINTHTHVYEHLSRGLIPDNLRTRPWAYNYFLPFQAVMTEEEGYISALFASLDMLKSGTTCFIDSDIPVSIAHLESAAQAINDIGMRAVLGRSLCDKRPNDLPSFWRPEWVDSVFSKSSAHAVAEMEEVLRRWSNRPTGRIRAWAGIHGWLSLCSDELFIKARQLAEKYGVGTEYHIATFIEEAREAEKQFGMWPITYLDRLGALGSNVLLVHVIAVSDEEVDLLAKRGTKVAHCPGTALKLAKGASQMGKMPEMVNRGVTVSLGADGVCSCGTFDATRQMFLVAGLFKDGRLDPTMIPAETAVEMGTINGARALMWEDEIGSIEVGKRADIVLFDTQRPEWLPIHDVVRNFVYSANGASVKSVFVDGRLIMKDGKVLTIDEGKLLGQVQEIGERITRRAGLKPNSAWVPT